VIDLRADWPAIARQPDSPLDSGATAENLASVIYTSGSTGTPKGVLVSHANAVRLLTAAQPWVGAGASDVWTLFHSAAFDFSVWELWGALGHGGRLVIVPRDVTHAPGALIALLDRERVTVLWPRRPGRYLTCRSMHSRESAVTTRRKRSCAFAASTALWHAVCL
jgi:non-ribosomal peptide synthetase component F